MAKVATKYGLTNLLYGNIYLLYWTISGEINNTFKDGEYCINRNTH